jgi:peroxiredoxin
LLYQIEDLIPDEVDGLAAGMEAPAFELPDLVGRPVLLEQYRGSRVLLTFLSSTCPHSQELAPEFAKLPWDGEAGRPVPVVVAIGDPEGNRAMVAEHNIRCPVLLDEKIEILRVFEAGGTPAAYLIDEQGVIVAPRADGGPDVLRLAERPPSPRAEPRREAPASHHHDPADHDHGHEGRVATAFGRAAVKREFRLPFAGVPEEGIGVGDLVKRMTDVLHIKPCRGCEDRRQSWNRWVIKGSGGRR